MVTPSQRSSREQSDTEALAARLLAAHTMPQKAAADALHVAAAALGDVEYLLTLNCKHIDEETADS